MRVMATNILDLPDDILFEVASFFEDSTNDLLRIIRTHRRFIPEAQRYLYRQVSFGLCSTKIVAFHRTLTATPAFARFVHSFHITCDGIDLGYIAETTQNPVLTCLRNLPNVRSVSYSCNQPEFRHRSCGHTLALILKRCTPRSVDIAVDHYPIAIIFDIIRLPSVQSLRLPSRISCPEHRKITTNICNSKLKQLELGPNRVPFRFLREILWSACWLERLAARLPQPPSELPEALSPALILVALEPVKDTLKELEMLDDGRGFRYGTDETRADFATFKNLRKMRVAPGLWFSVAAFSQGTSNSIDDQIGLVWKNEDRSGVYKLLPYSLEELEVYFHFETALFAMGTMYLRNFQKNPVVPAEGYKWIIELAANKLAHFPNLRRVSLVEQISAKVDFGYARGQQIAFEPLPWTPPTELQEAFDSAGIVLNIELRSNYRLPTV